MRGPLPSARGRLRGRPLVVTALGTLAAATVVALLVVFFGGGGQVSNVFVAPSGSDEAACTREAPCASFGHAYAVAEPGEIVEVAGGVYPRQTVTSHERRRAGEHVVLRPADGATVVVEALELGTGPEAKDGPRGLTIERMQIADASGHESSVAAFPGTRDVVLEELDGANFYLNGVKDFTVRGGDWGPCRSSGDEAADGCGNSKIDANPENDRITVEGAVFHDYRAVPGSGAHFECLFVAGGTNIAVRDSRFEDCEFYDIFVQHFGVPTDGLRIEGNTFDTPWNGAGAKTRATGIALSPRGQPFRDVVVRGNTFVGTGISVNDDGDATRYSNVRIEANRGMSYGCDPSVEYSANVWDAGPLCGPTDRTRSR